MSRPETLKDLIEETIRNDRLGNDMKVSGVPYEVPASGKQFGGDHYKKMGIEPWDVVDTWPIEQRIGYYRGGALKYIMRMGSKDESPQEIEKGRHYMEKLLEVLNAR